MNSNKRPILAKFDINSNVKRYKSADTYIQSSDHSYIRDMIDKYTISLLKTEINNRDVRIKQLENQIKHMNYIITGYKQDENLQCKLDQVTKLLEQAENKIRFLNHYISDNRKIQVVKK